jgi:hypothetical protein
MADLKANGQAVWSDAAFHQFIAIATSNKGQVAGGAKDERIVLPDEVMSKSVWYVTAVRFDPSAPGFSQEIHEKLGQELQIRLIVQPVTRNKDGTFKVHDIAAHLVYEFNAGYEPRPEADKDCFPKPRPDDGLSRMVAQELVDLRTRLGGSDLTAGKPLGVHPALAGPATAAAARRGLKALLERHLSASRLGFMTITAIGKTPTGEDVPKWFFLGMINLRGVHARVFQMFQIRQPRNSSQLHAREYFIPMTAPALDGAQYTEMYFGAPHGFPGNLGSRDIVVPTPHPNNDYRNDHDEFAITCHNGANAVPGPPLGQRIGYSTADVIERWPFDRPDRPDVVRDRMMAVFNRIIDRDKSHSFNTDCVSCHTETPLYRDRLHKTVPGIDPSTVPTDNLYNMRIFGWFPVQLNDGSSCVRPAASRRARNETWAVSQYMNNLLGAPSDDVDPFPMEDANAPIVGSTGPDCP